MKKIIIPLLIVFTSCTSVKKYNQHLNDLIPPEKLIHDADFAYNKIKKMHPKLYWYIRKENLDYKFDSVKKTITTPITSLEFYKKLAPIVAAVKQGHMFTYPPQKQYTKKESKIFTKNGIGPLSQFDFEILDNKLYIIKNKSNDKTIKTGTEILKIDDQNPMDFLNNFKNYFTSDGFNTTMKTKYLGKRFSTIYTYGFGIKDSLTYQLKYNDSSKTVVIKRKKPETRKSKITLTDGQKDSIKAKIKAFNKDKSKNGYDKISKTNFRNLKFLQKDSTVAVLKIKGFKNGNFRKFYKDCFQKIKDQKSKTLIIDLRDNGGGRLAEINDLYAYLADSTYTFLDKSIVTSRNSLFQYVYLKGGNPILKTLKIAAAPLVYPVFYLFTKKDSEGNFYENIFNKPQVIKENAFRGKIYVHINGGSFSASSIISSNLKGSKRATFVGEETGGAFNGTVAGFMPLIQLPNSKIKIKIGIMTCEPHYKSIEGRGIFPDKEIIPTITDRINGKDPEMDWILNQIKEVSN
jgi:C-terminal processing protease CtpA/Prc